MTGSNTQPGSPTTGQKSSPEKYPQSCWLLKVQNKNQVEPISEKFPKGSFLDWHISASSALDSSWKEHITGVYMMPQMSLKECNDMEAEVTKVNNGCNALTWQRHFYRQSTVVTIKTRYRLKIQDFSCKFVLQVNTGILFLDLFLSTRVTMQTRNSCLSSSGP